MMKPLQLIFAALAALMLAACSSEAPVPDDRGVAQISIALVSAPDSPASRSLDYQALRPLYSSQAASEVSSVSVQIFEQTPSGWVDAAYPVISIIGLQETAPRVFEWTLNNPNSSLVDYSNTEILRLEQLKPNTTYRLVATAIPPASGHHTFDGSAVTLAPYTSEIPGESCFKVDETFGGAVEFTTDERGHVSAGHRLPMYRQVAGILGYFVNIPADVDGTDVKYIRIVASAHAEAYAIPSGSLQNQLATIAGDVTAIEIEIPSTALRGADGLYKIPASATPCATVENSLLSGRFLVPFARQAGGTFTLSICDADRAPLRSWKCAVADPAEGETRLSYSVNRNHFYSFGYKPDAISTDADRPIDLSAATEIEITVTTEPLLTTETEIPVH